MCTTSASKMLSKTMIRVYYENNVKAQLNIIKQYIIQQNQAQRPSAFILG